MERSKNILSRIKSYITVFFIFICNLIFTQNNNWPFKDKNNSSQTIAGNITGTVSEARFTNLGGLPVRFHGGVDFTSPYTENLDGKAVFSMHTGTAYWNGSSTYGGSHIYIITNSGQTVYYKHILPDNYNPLHDVPAEQIPTNGIAVTNGQFLGLMISHSNQHVHINQNSLTNNLYEGEVNYLYSFLSPFLDNNAPNIRDINTNSIINNASNFSTIEFRENGHCYDGPTNSMNLAHTDVNSIERRILFGKQDLILKTTDPHIRVDDAIQGNNGIDKISFKLRNPNGDILLEETNINFQIVPKNNIANKIIDNRSTLSSHVYIISNNNSFMPYDRFLNTASKLGSSETYDLENRDGLDAVINHDSKYKDGYYNIEASVHDRNNFNNTNPNFNSVISPILIDNFLPYIKKVTLSDSEGVFYEAEWALNNSETELELDQCTYRNGISTGFNVQIEASETMNNLSMNLAGVTNNLISTNNEKTVWELQNPFTENASSNQTITFTGSDTAGNSLLTDPSNLYYRVSDTSWNSYTANSPTTPSMGSDTIHKINQSPNCSDSCTDNYEPNDTQSQATPLYVFGHNFSWSDSLVDECLDQATADIDWYRMNLTHQGELIITLSSQQISSLFMDWLDNGNVTSSTTVNGEKQIIICSNNGLACYDTALRIYTVTQNGNEPIPYTLDIQWSANQSCSSGRQSNTNSTTQNSSTITINGNTSVCEGLSNTLSASGASGPFDWFVNGQSVHIGNTFNTQSLNTGQYDLFVIATDDVCSFAETQLNITSGVTANAGSNVTIQNGSSTTLQGSGGTSCSWSPTTGLSNPNSCTTTASPTQTTTYTLTVTENGCTDTDMVTVTIDGSGGGNPPANDDCSDAITLTSSTSCNYTTGTVEDATPSFGANHCDGCSCTSPDDYDVYYKFTAVETSHTVTVSNYASNFDAVIELRTACSSGSSNYISCYDPTGSPSSVSETWTGLTVGQTYYIRVFEWGYQQSPPNADTFDICVTHQNTNTNGIDLVSNITSVSNNNPDAGNQITVNYSVTNNGDETMTDNTTSALYLSNNQTYGSSDILITGSVYALTTNLSPNQSINLSSTVTIPNVSDGQYYIISYPDLPNLITESDNDNNIDAYTIQIGDVVQNGPDLDVTRVRAVPDTGLVPGQEVEIEIRIENEGNEDSSSFDVLVYLDIDGDDDYDSNEFMGEFTFNSLDAGENDTMFVDYDLPSNITSTGVYELYVIADSNNDVNETDEGNNDKDDNVTISLASGGSEDVALLNEAINTTTVNAGETVDAVVNHVYLGSQTTDDLPTLNLAYYLSTDCNFSVAEDIYLEGDTSNLGINNPNVDEDETLTIPASTPSGTYYILFIADSDNEVEEGALENNNVECIQITVNGTSTPNGDIYITDEVCNPTDVIIGSEIEPFANIHYTGSQTNANLPSIEIFYFLSNDCTLSNDDILISDDSISLGSDLPVNDASDIIQLPSDLSPGTYYIIFRADTENAVYETNENNNIACAEFNLLPADANYEDVTFNSPYVEVAEASIGDQVYASIHQNYTGYQTDGDISSIQMKYYLSTDCILSTDDYYFTDDYSSLGSDDPSQFEFANLIIPSTINAGDYYILFVADTEDIIVENDENNNTACVPITIIETLSIEDNDFVNKIKVYPNPVSDLLTINLGEVHSKINLEVFNVLGQRVNSLVFKQKQIVTVNTSSLSNGIYFFKIKTDSIKSAEFKIIKE